MRNTRKGISKNKRIVQNDKSLREKIVASMIASFRLEGIIIPSEKAAIALKRLEQIAQKAALTRLSSTDSDLASLIQLPINSISIRV